MTCYLKQRLERDLRAANECLKAFESRMARDGLMPALEWSLALFDRAPVLHYAPALIARLEDGESPESVKAYCRDEALRMAEYPVRSTSPTACLVRQCELAYLASIARTIR